MIVQYGYHQTVSTLELSFNGSDRRIDGWQTGYAHPGEVARVHLLRAQSSVA